MFEVHWQNFADAADVNFPAYGAFSMVCLAKA